MVSLGVKTRWKAREIADEKNKNHLLPDSLRNGKYSLHYVCKNPGRKGNTEIFRDTNYALDLIDLEEERNDPVALIGFAFGDTKMIVYQIQARERADDEPLDLPRRWEKVLLGAAINFAREKGLETISVLEASKNRWWLTYAYSFPDFYPGLFDRLKMRYDVTSKRMGFRYDGDLGEWVMKLDGESND